MNDKKIEDKYRNWLEMFFSNGDSGKHLIEEASFKAGYETAQKEMEEANGIIVPIDAPNASVCFSMEERLKECEKALTNIFQYHNFDRGDINTLSEIKEYFKKWGGGMSEESVYAVLDRKEKQLKIVNHKVEVLKQLLLLTHPAVSSEIVNEIAMKQWLAFIKEFPDESEEVKF